jgi:hypothetical protein
MNSIIETAVISNLKSKFPSSMIFTGMVVQGIQPDNIIVNTVMDVFNVSLGIYKQRVSSISVTVISPTSDTVVDDLINCLSAFTVDGETYFPEALEVSKSDDTVQVIFDLTYLER